MRLAFLSALALSLAVLSGCETSDLAEKPVDLGDFALGLNIVVADNVQMVPISRPATPDEWEGAMKKAVQDRFGRYQGSKLYNIGIVVEGYALAPPGIPVVAAPKSILVVTANVWDDAAQKKLNEEGKQITVFESLSGDTVVGSGLTRTKDEQMAALSYNVAKRVEEWFLENPEWFGLPPLKKGVKPPKPTVMSAPKPATAVPAPVAPAAATAPLSAVTPPPAATVPAAAGAAPVVVTPLPSN